MRSPPHPHDVERRTMRPSTSSVQQTSGASHLSLGSSAAGGLDGAATDGPCGPDGGGAGVGAGFAPDARGGTAPTGGGAAWGEAQGWLGLRFIAIVATTKAMTTTDPGSVKVVIALDASAPAFSRIPSHTCEAKA